MNVKFQFQVLHSEITTSLTFFLSKSEYVLELKSDEKLCLFQCVKMNWWCLIWLAVWVFSAFNFMSLFTVRTQSAVHICEKTSVSGIKSQNAHCPWRILYMENKLQKWDHLLIEKIFDMSLYNIWNIQEVVALSGVDRGVSFSLSIEDMRHKLPPSPSPFLCLSLAETHRLVLCWLWKCLYPLWFTVFSLE